MKSEDITRFSEAFNNVYKMYKHQGAPEDVIKVYFDYLKQFELREVLTGMRKAMDASTDYFPPAPAIKNQIEIITGRKLDDRAHIATQEVIGLIEAGMCKRAVNEGAYLSVPAESFPTDLVRDRALRACPPPDKHEDMKYWGARFRSCYEVILEEINLYGMNGRQLIGPRPMSALDAQQVKKELEGKGLPAGGLKKIGGGKNEKGRQ